MNITIYNEYLHEKYDEQIKGIYPDGIHGCIAKFLTEEGHVCKTGTLDDPECGLTDEVLANTDVLIWWGHMGHHLVPDEVIEKVYNRVMEGMGMVVLHSGHNSKIFKKLCGTNAGELKWRDDDEKEILWVVDPSHPIVQGIGENIILEKEEMYGEHFIIPTPDELVFISWFAGGEVFRSGCVFKRGNGKIFYFRPGHESVPTYHNEKIQQVIKNAVKYVKNESVAPVTYGYVEPTVEWNK